MSKTILITGTSSGFGKLMAKTLLDNDYQVIATMRDSEDRNKDAAEELKAYASDKENLLILDLDVTNTASVTTATEKALAKFSTIDVLINNAGYGVGGMTEGFTEEQYEKLLAVNVLGVHRVTRAVLPAMRKQGSGLIINISSLMGRIILPFSSLYTATKYAIEGYSESLSYELKPVGIDVAIIEPGGFGTGFFDNMKAPNEDARVEAYGDYADTPNQMWNDVEEKLEGEDSPNPQQVADTALQLIQQNPEDRPMRVVVDPLMGGAGANDINELTNKKQKEVLENMGMGQMF